MYGVTLTDTHRENVSAWICWNNIFNVSGLFDMLPQLSFTISLSDNQKVYNSIKSKDVWTNKVINLVDRKWMVAYLNKF